MRLNQFFVPEAVVQGHSFGKALAVVTASTRHLSLSSQHSLQGVLQNNYCHREPGNVTHC